ncbi:DUF4246 domain-containing protein [Actinospica durhamensis]|uniref:DUF4246 domain-containing protein n=1 Tax=Actinospica durhamensis TaxID=1508375 RepID=A0A941EIT6_9ACTN|nr:DUF4246 domain-containing protein [Actinospica durhamensis]MBR7833300.1 DUF4246 domain-containing protein [Actinospica durhamensis]
MSETAAFPLPFAGAYRLPVANIRTLRELAMMRMSAVIRAKPQWHVKMNDAEIVARWTREAAEQGMTQAQIRYVLAELAYYAGLRDEPTGIEVSGVDGVWQSDTLIDEKLRSRLREAVRVLEDVPDAELDWHPGSDGQVLDLVHPSLFCLVRDVSRPDTTSWPTSSRGEAQYALSNRFQWLPTDVEVDEDGDAVFCSYVNNLHPVDHRELADILPILVGRMRPLLENVLTDLSHPRPLRIETASSSWYEGEPRGPWNPEIDYPADAFEVWEDAMTEWLSTRTPIVPDAPAFTPPAASDAARVDLRGRRLQVIVKLAAIHLTPDKPDYAGGAWHVEGMMNERIVATGIYYWDSENITESRLGFRAAVDPPGHEQNDRAALRDIYGLENEAALNQVLGAAETRAGRALAFPNALQHRVGPFRLADPTRPGYRKILVFFLVEPSETIVSTSDVPPQQPWSPTSTMTLEQAKAYREELMQERKFVVDAHSGRAYEREFSLCEH